MPSLTSIWGANANDIWAVGDYGTFVHWDGTSWSEVPGAASTHDTFLGVWGQDAEHVWAVGTHGYINFYDGSSWHEEQAPAHRTLYEVGGNSDGVWALGAGGTLLFKPFGDE